MRYSRLLAVVVCLISSHSHAICAQESAVPIRMLGAVAVTQEPIGNIGTIRVLSNGRVLVNDVGRRRLLLLDSTLQHPITVADTTSATAKAYGGGLTALMAFTGDSSLIQDPMVNAFLVLDPDGKVARIIPMPRTPGSAFPGVLGPPIGFDQAGHLLFRSQSLPAQFSLPPEFRGDTILKGADSTAILRVDLGTRRVDTIAKLQLPVTRLWVTRRDNGRGNGSAGNSRQVTNPIPSGDDWTLMNDGTVAVIRVRDFHIDWIRPDGHVTAGPKTPTQWVRVTDSMKVAIIDSLRRRDSIQTAQRNAATSPAMREALAKDSADRAEAALAGGRGGPIGPIGPQQAMYVLPSDLPDYRPPFTSGFALADAEGNVWVRETASGPFDVINRNGQMIDRVQIPIGLSVIGFGPGVVYLISRTGGPLQPGGLVTQLIKVRIH